jgi:hypothetical protein
MIKLPILRLRFSFLSLICRFFPSNASFRKMKIACGLLLISMLSTLSSCDNSNTNQISNKRSLRSIFSLRINKPDLPEPDTTDKAQPAQKKIKKNLPACYDPVVPIQDTDVNINKDIQRPTCYAPPAEIIQPVPRPDCYKQVNPNPPK